MREKIAKARIDGSKAFEDWQTTRGAFPNNPYPIVDFESEVLNKAWELGWQHGSDYNNLLVRYEIKE